MPGGARDNRGGGGADAGADKNDARVVIWVGVNEPIRARSWICSRAQIRLAVACPMP